MFNIFNNHLGAIPLVNGGKSRAINAENPTGEKGRGGMAASNLGVSRKGSPCLTIKSGEETLLADINGTGVINHIWMTVTNKTSEGDCFVLRDLVLRIYWDQEETPSVEAPLGDFFCLGFGASYTVNSYPIVVNPLRGMNCYFPMPFGKQARITVENQHVRDIGGFFYQVDYCLYDSLPENTGYFHARWRRENPTIIGKDYTILDQVQGRGQYVGTFMALQTLERYWWGEGEIKYFIDGDTEYPTICGTGMEDYFGGAWSFARHENGNTVETTYNTPFLGYPYYSSQDDIIKHPCHNSDCPPMRSFYRWHLPDPIYFEEDLRVTIQQIGVSHNGLFERSDDVSTVAYWYQLEPHHPFPALPERKLRIPR